MGCFLSLSLKPTTASSAAFFVLLITLLTFLSTPSNADSPKLGDIATTFLASPPRDEDTVDSAVKPNSFRPSIVVIVGVLTTLFTLTFLLLLYAKHCKRGTFVVYSSGPPRAAALRKNSGIDRTVVESLPVFRFASLRGHKDGLECAVCLTRFEPTEVLRLLPKCKHAFHVECVDTWLDAHSTCPLCRYRVDPEDILLIEETRFLPHQNNSHPQTPAPPHQNDVVIDIENDNLPGFRRVSGRHSSALERRPGSSNSSNDNTSSFRRSFDSWTWFRKKSEPTSAVAAAGCIDRPRKDGLLLPQEKTRLEHRIIVSSPRSSNTGNGNGVNQRWSDVEPSDLLYLQSEMIMSDSDVTRQRQQGEVGLRGGNGAVINAGSGSGRGVISERSVSEITGLSRFASRGSSSNERSSNNKINININTNHRSQTQNQNRQQQRQLRLASRWVAWVSSHHSRPPLPVRPDRQETPPPPLPSTVPTG